MTFFLGLLQGAECILSFLVCDIFSHIGNRAKCLFFCCLVPILQAGDGACVGIYVNDLSSALVGSGVPL